MGKEKVVYILGSVRSGSTLTDLLLGSHPEVWTLGEAQLLPFELREQRDPCGCGSPITDCDFWNAVLPHIPLDTGKHPIGHFRESHSCRKTFRWREGVSLLSRVITSRQARHARSYGELNAKYFSSVRREAVSRGSSVEWLVDASNGPYRPYWLLYSGQFDLRVIHLTKDPRAYVHSISRRLDSFSVQDIIRWAARWTVGNLIHSALTRWHMQKEHYMHVRYEDLASSPNRFLRKFENWLGLESDKNSKKDVIRNYTNHALSGNEMRWKDTKIYLDEKWKKEMSKRDKNIVWVISKFLAKRFGYREGHGQG
ncbi:hypothetical protein GGP86_001434 [Salinibacter ruber]|uniref:sulfotransferase n=1 Tax=Salinibacter ruber TaxID=146919 RepID=UPI0021691757|nr:sulfotransferase [Salinibacter ruber]MCS3861656.1 hypothetical protein [Salinibacter ruber]